VALLLPHRTGTSTTGFAVCVAAGYAVAAFTVVAFDRLPAWSYGAIQAVGTVLITGGVYFSGAETSPLAVLYVWVALYAALLFERRWVAVQMGFVAAAYAAALIIGRSGSAGIEAWVIVVGSVLVVAAIASALRTRLEGLITELDGLARRDALTGMLNRRGFEEGLDIQLERARRIDGTVSLVLGDLDGFKAVNDRLGHQAGDAALRRVGEIVETTKRRLDLAARIGGEEFALVVPDGDEDSAFRLAERLRAAVAETFADDDVPLTISFGVSVSPGDHGDADLLLKRADQALYMAKRSGRDRAIAYREEPSD
jgi:diguanylate cyclase (GGDEF)-like protein